MASPAPLTSPTRTAEAPSEASNGPVTERAPSYTMSAARLTTPNPTTARQGDQDRPTVPTPFGGSGSVGMRLRPMTQSVITRVTTTSGVTSTRPRRWREARHHTQIVGGVGDPDRDTVGVLVQLQSYLDAIHRRPVEAEPKGPLAPGSVGRDVPAGDSRATNSRAAAVDPQPQRRGVAAGRQTGASALEYRLG